MQNLFRTYYRLAKPGIIYGNVVTATGGFLFATHGSIDWWLYVALIVGMSLIIGSGCVFNNYIDRDIDTLMARTKRRALVSGVVSEHNALIYGTVLGTLGFLILFVGTNLLVVNIGIIGFVSYVVLYGLAKRRTVHGTLVGTISGATPIVAGYCAATNQFDGVAVILFLILVLWQMPHFYAIALYRQSDYAAAHIPVLPVVSGPRIAKIHSLVYIAAFIVACVSLSAFGYAGYTYLAVMIGIGVWWLWRGLQSFKSTDPAAWGHTMFKVSLLVITAFSVMLSLDTWLP